MVGDNPGMVEDEVWEMVDALRGTMNASEYKHAVLGLIFLKYVSDAFEEHRFKLDLIQDADPEDPDEYRAQNIIWVPLEGRWTRIIEQARQPTIGQIVDGAMASIEKANPAIKNALPKNYARPTLDKTRLGHVIDLISGIRVDGKKESGSKYTLVEVYEYLLSRFASAKGKKKDGGFFTPPSVSRLLVEMLRPYRGHVYDPCCGSSGILVQSIKFIETHANDNDSKNRTKTTSDISIYGQESNYDTWQLAKMNLVMRNVDTGKIVNDDSLHSDQHPDLKADYILAHPPFDASDWGGDLLQDDKRWVYGVPPTGNANFAWVQHAVSHMALFGTAGLVLGNGSMTSDQSDEGKIRMNLVEANLVDCVVALPSQLFYSTQMPACLWFLSRNRIRGGQNTNVLFIDARQMGKMTTHAHRNLTDDDIHKVSYVYRTWCGDKQTDKYFDVPRFCKSATLDEIRKHGYLLTPSRYVDVAPKIDDGESFDEKMERLVSQWGEQNAQSKKLDAAIVKSIKSLGFDIKKV